MGFRQWMAGRVPRWGVRWVARPYVAGDSLAAALAVADRLQGERRIGSTLDVLGENVRDPDEARRALDLYLEAVEAAAARPHVTLSFKPGHFGFHQDPTDTERRMRTLADAAGRRGVPLTIDMEDRDLTDFTLDVYRRLLRDRPGLGTVLQTRLHRTEADLRSLAGLGARVRLCIGVYDVPAEAGYRRKAEAKENLLRLLPLALESLAKVEIASHDPEVVRRAREIVERSGVPGDRVEFQMLLGVPRRELQEELQAAGHAVRLYVPFAPSWDEAIAYLRRRLAESPSVALLVARNLGGGR